MRTGRVRFEISVNGERKCVAGIESSGVLSASLVWTGNAHEEVTPEMRSDPDFDEQEWLSDYIHVRLGGLDSETQEHLKWYEQDLQPGDEVAFRVLPGGECDAPVERRTREQVEQTERDVADA